MVCISQISSRRMLLAALVVGSAAALFGALPSRGQQPTVVQPDAQVTVPATASQGRTRVDYALTLPAGLTLVDWPAVRVVDGAGKLVEYAHLSILQRTPRLTAFHRLWTKAYPPGTYQVTIEATYQRADGTTAQFVTPAARLTVPG